MFSQVKKVKIFYAWKVNYANTRLMCSIYDALRDLVPFMQIKKHEKHTWRSVTFKPATLVKVTLFHGCFLHLNCWIFRLYKQYQNVQSVLYVFSQLWSYEGQIVLTSFSCFFSWFELIQHSNIIFWKDHKITRKILSFS